mmetsp:Transcript_29312/g.49474  ORF Transcript_29312/g.49474 Transcript_29312/m.49474 type:complete len:209 (-) Transcript_29312:293-919(-)
MESQGAGAQAPPPPHGSNAITDLLDEMKMFLQNYGWYIVLAVVAFYLLQPQLQTLRAELSLRQANNPTRRKILDEERKRVRLQQQMDLLRAQETKAAASSDAKSEEESVEGGDKVTAPAASSGKPSTLKKRTVKKEKKSSGVLLILGLQPSAGRRRGQLVPTKYNGSLQKPATRGLRLAARVLLCLCGNCSIDSGQAPPCYTRALIFS